MIKMLAALVAAFVFWGCSSKENMIPQKGYISTPDGVRLFYQKAGKGKQIVFIPNGLYYIQDFQLVADSRTLIFYDVRNRGYSDTITDPAKLKNGIWQDIEDLETVRKHFAIDRMDLMGHSYIGLMIGLYSMKYPDRVNRLVQISPAQPDAAKQYSPPLSFVDSVIMDVMGKLAQLQSQPRSDDPVKRCNEFWSLLAPINVMNPANVTKIDWGRCDVPNERNFMQYWTEHLAPSIQNIHLTAEDLSNMNAPVLILHGDKDRSAPYGGAQDWARMWPNARLVTVKNVAHAPWIEAPDVVFSALNSFLSGDWPSNAETIER